MKNHTTYVWHVDLNKASPTQNNYFWSLLTQDEKDRANRFYSETHRRRFIIARGALRHLAGQLLDQAPETLQFGYTNHGKPIFKHHPNVQFNLSHSHHRALYAFALNIAVGVDIEHQNPQCDMAGIARRFFAPREYTALRALQDAAKTALFFKLWVRKEAIAKALGIGLSVRALAEIEFDVEEPMHLSIGCNRILNPNEWSLYTLDPERDFAAALAIQAHSQHIEVQSMDLSLHCS